MAVLGLIHGILRVDEQRFHLLLKEWIAGAGAFNKNRSLKRIITFDGIGQNCFHLLPAFRSHFSTRE